MFDPPECQGGDSIKFRKVFRVRKDFQNTFREDPDSIKIGNLPKNYSENPSKMLNENVTCINCSLCSTLFGFGECFGKDFRKDIQKLIESGPRIFPKSVLKIFPNSENFSELDWIATPVIPGPGFPTEQQGSYSINPAHRPAEHFIRQKYVKKN